jgi:hypothetical protein
MTKRLPTLLALAALIALLLPAAGAQPERGRALYELRCTGCHSESVHARVKRVATDFDAVRGWVKRWDRDLKLGWSAEEIEDVTVYLNDTYYRHPCPPSVCKVISRASPATSGKPSSS